MGNTYVIMWSQGKHNPTQNNKEEHKMTMSEASRVILGLRAAGWSERDINDFILWIETGEEQYKPKNKSSND